MKDTSFIEKIQVLADVSSSSGICIASIFIILFVAVILITMNKKNSKKLKSMIIIIYIALILGLVITYSSSLSSMFDYMMNNFFIALYFPNLAIYLAAIIASNIIIWKTLFGNKKDKILTIVNVVMYSIMNYLLVLVLNVVLSSDIDVFDNSSVYANKDALALIGLSSTIFIVWIIFMIIYSIIRKTQPDTKSEYTKVKTVYKRILPSNILEVAKPKVVKEIYRYKFPSNIVETVKPMVVRSTTKKILPSNILETVAPMVVKEDIKHRLPANTGVIRAPKVIKDYGIKQIVAPKLAKGINIEKSEYKQKEKVKLIDFETIDRSLEKEYDNMLSLEDYKTVLDILKNKDKYQKQPEYKTPETNIVEQTKEVFVQPKLDELLNLSNA